MRKEEIIAQAKADGIVLSRSQLERYIQNGLLIGHRQSEGYKKGVVSFFPNAMDTIRFIAEYTKTYKLKKNTDLLFLLFWNGFPVDEDKLKRELVEYQYTLNWVFHKISKEREDSSKLETMLDRLWDDDKKLIQKKPGRPSKQVQAEQKKLEAHYRMEYKLFMTFIRDGFLKKSIAWEAVEAFFKVHVPFVYLDLKGLYVQLLDVSKSFKWISHSDPIDFLLLKKTVGLLQHYQTELYVLGQISFLDPTGEMNRQHRAGWLGQDPEFTRFALILILASRQLPQLHHMLQSKELETFAAQVKLMLNNATNLEGGVEHEPRAAVDR
ncbi:hypothetical protein [Saccharibacillus sacchari]|uniref:hypothetical protein n=1 Tax=Saccharibacillus sacchari TaxID=456493 RepID=UPI0004BA2FEB|nr:hypothetical protein [Saccharibacillus sacchari]